MREGGSVNPTPTPSLSLSISHIAHSHLFIIYFFCFYSICKLYFILLLSHLVITEFLPWP